MRVISRVGQFFAVMILATFLVSAPALAVDSTDNDKESTKLTAANMCDTIDSVRTKNQAAVAEQRETVTTKFTGRLTGLEERRTSTEEKLATARQQAADTFSQKVKELESISGLSDDQLAAVKTFKEMTVASERTREEAVDGARQTYLAGLRAIISNRQDDLSAAVANFDTLTTAAFQRAKSNCSSSSALTTLRSDLKAARNTLTDAIGTPGQTNTITPLIETRNAAIKEANQNFRSSAKQYAEELATALNISVTITVDSDTDT